MVLALGVRLGPYEVTALIGEGGMGEVYRATDTNLKRAVAIKVLPESVAGDRERLARFGREAEVLASLNHPNIAAIYGLERSNGVTALVMELVEGPTLADRIAQGPIPVDEALPIAKQISEALEAAHEQGIIHRDLKPANIKVRPDGTVKVLDFGLAKALEPASVAGMDATASPTITSPALMTGVGVLLGTAAYMSPEQARGKAVDKRSDIWAFGCVLYEMLTAKRCFDGDDVADTLAFILTKEPDWSAIPASTPPSICNLLRRCLDKDRRRRIGDVAAALFAIDEAGALDAAGTRGAWSFAARPIPLWRRFVLFSVPAIVLTVAIASAAWFVMRPLPPHVSRLNITTPAASAWPPNANDRNLTITPDGSRIVYVGAGGQLFVRALDTLAPIPIFRGTPRGLFISPDGQWIGFANNNTTLTKLAVTGGPAMTIAQMDGPSRGGTWLPDEWIIFATSNPTTGLQRISAAGGMPSVLTRPDPAQRQVDHLWPEMLPGGRAVLFTITTAGGLNAAQVAVLDLQTGTQKVLVRGGSHAHYVASGHLTYVAAGTLQAVPFDLDRLEPRGTAVPVIPGVVTDANGGVDASVAANGTLAYVTGAGAGMERTLVWVDRQGQETLIAVPTRTYIYPRLSPDGTRVALFLDLAEEQDDIWLWDFERQTLTRLTISPAQENHSAWTPDGRRLFFSSNREGAWNLYLQATDGTGAVERLTESPHQQDRLEVSPDGTRLIFTEVMPETTTDIMQMQLDGSRRVMPLVQTPFAEQNGIVSPDGRWIAYEANNSGQFEVYVRPFPDVRSGVWHVSTGGGTRPLWAPSGQELFYLAPNGALMRVGVERGPSWTATTPSTLLKESQEFVRVPGGNPGRTYDISPDGQRFLMIKAVGADEGTPSPSIVVVQNWHEELKRLVPVD
jgi:serine/threonine-protein kinase